MCSLAWLIGVLICLSYPHISRSEAVARDTQLLVAYVNRNIFGSYPETTPQVPPLENRRTKFMNTDQVFTPNTFFAR